MCFFQLLTRFTCIKFSPLLEGVFLSLIVLIFFKKKVQPECNIIVHVRRDRLGVFHVCDVTYLELRRSKRPYCFNVLDSNVLFRV